MKELNIRLTPIGVIRTSFTDEEVKKSWPKGVSGIIEIFPEFEDGLKGIDGFSHVLIVSWLHKVNDEQRKVLMVKHRRFTRYGIPLSALPLIGVFCTDSPHRPNPIGLSIVRIIKREGRFIHVDGLDLFDGTPVLDLRAITPEFLVKDITVPKWYMELKELIKKYVGDKICI